MAIPNQATDSRRPGYLQPQEPPYPDAQIIPGQPLENFLQQWVAGVAYMEETLVRPRWQLVPPNLPDVGTDWCAVGILDTRPVGIYPAAWPWIYGEPYNVVQYQRHEEFELLCTFYGPQADEYASNLHDGACVWQNYAPLRLVGVKLVEVHESRHAPELVKNQWLKRIDKEITFRRIIRKNYPILTIQGVRAWIDSCAPRISIGIPPPDGWPPAPLPDAPQDGSTYGRGPPGEWQRVLPVAGGTMEGPLHTSASPSQPDETANKRYVDDSGLDGNRY
jgi:hypothetical protein